MIIRPFKESDVGAIERIHEKFHSYGFSMPDISEAYAHVVAEEDGQVLAYGQIRDITESIMVLDHSIQKRKRVEALAGLMREAIFSATNRGADQIHAFVQDQSFEDVLKRKFGYKECKGKALVMNI